MSLKDELIKVMEASVKVGEYDQRSALGITDSFVRGSSVDTEAAKYSAEGIPENREALAAMLIQTLRDASTTECKEALHKARLWLNTPYINDPRILKWRAERAARFPKGLGLGD